MQHFTWRKRNIGASAVVFSAAAPLCLCITCRIHCCYETKRHDSCGVCVSFFVFIIFHVKYLLILYFAILPKEGKGKASLYDLKLNVQQNSQYIDCLKSYLRSLYKRAAIYRSFSLDADKCNDSRNYSWTTLKWFTDQLWSPKKLEKELMTHKIGVKRTILFALPSFPAPRSNGSGVWNVF